MRHVLGLMLFALASSAMACECAFAPLGDEQVRRAGSIFVFQIMSARVDTEGEMPAMTREIDAEIRVVETMLGEAPADNRMRYGTFHCCGSRIDVGHYYAAFLEESQSPFVGHAGNLLSLGGSYSSEHRVGQRMRAIASGEASIETFVADQSAADVVFVPYPPAPGNVCDVGSASVRPCGHGQ